jgi:hypothetical protein
MVLKSGSSSYEWNEPLFFLILTSTRVGWIVRVGVFLAIYVLFVFLLTLDKNSPQEMRLPAAVVLLLPAFIGGLFLAMYEVPTLQRKVSLTDKDIGCAGTLMMFGGMSNLLHMIVGRMGQWNRREIKLVQLLRPGEPGNRFSFGLMIVTPKYAAPRKMGVPCDVPLDEVATRLHAMQLIVQLSGWQADAPPPHGAIPNSAIEPSA